MAKEAKSVAPVRLSVTRIIAVGNNVFRPGCSYRVKPEIAKKLREEKVVVADA